MKYLLASSVLFASLSVFAQAKPPHPSTVVVSDAERHEYYINKDLISDVAADCLNSTWDTHVQFFNKYKVSKYYGDRNPNLNTREKRLAVVRKVGAPDSIVDLLEGTSCIGLTRKCLRNAIAATESPVLKSLWQRIDANVIANGVSGVILIQHLQKLGWKVMYWNPNPANNVKWDQEDPRLTQGKPVTWNSGVKNSNGQYIYNPAWGMHEARYNTVMKSNNYFNVRIDDKTTLVNFGTIQPDAFKAIPFFVGTAHAGYHVFPGMFGKVIEAHSMRRLDSIDNMEVGEFNPLATGGAPKWTNSEKYRSGIIAVPPK